MLFVDLQVRLKDLKLVYLHFQLNDVIINAFLALLEVTLMYIFYMYNIQNSTIYLYCNLDKIARKYYILVNKTYLNGYQR